MSDHIRELYEERLGRYQAAIALEPTDRVPIAPANNSFAATYSGFNHQELLYDDEKVRLSEIKFARDFPQVDALRGHRLWGPLLDAVGYRLFKLSGRDLPPGIPFQFVEDEYMKADEYRLLVDDPVTFLIERYLPRALGECAEKGSRRRELALLKGGMVYVHYLTMLRNRSLRLEKELGLPQPTASVLLAPFDYLADGLRGLRGIMMDIYRQPDAVLEACDALVPRLVEFAISNADPLRRYPILIPTHKACFMSQKQFDRFYWPSLKKAMLMLVEAGYKMRVFLEGDWNRHWHHLNEIPRGAALCDVDNEGDIFRAKAEFGQQQCIAGGVPDTMLILGTPDEVRQRVKLLCETVGKDGGFMVNGGCCIPYETKPENFRALVQATVDYGTYDGAIKPRPKPAPPQPEATGLPGQMMVTPWEVKRAELGGVLGDEDLIRHPWEKFEAMAFNWLWMWTQC